MTECPRRFVTPEVWETIEFAELYRQGIPPEAGGALDQAAWFIHAARFIWSEQDFWKHQLLVMDT